MIMNKPVSSVLLAIVACLVGGAFGQTQMNPLQKATDRDIKQQGDNMFYTREVNLDSENIISLKWDVKEKDAIEFTVSAKTHGWIGIGISGNGVMKGSDMVIGWIHNGLVNFTDRHVIGEQQPIIDQEQNYDLLDAYENDTHTIFHYRRKFETCDKNDMTIQKHGTLKLIYAYGPNDPDEGKDIDFHETLRGSKSIFIVATNPEIPKIPEDSFYIDIMADEFPVPEKETLYSCKIFKLPKLEKKHHIVKVEAFIEAGNEDIVHHMTPYFCYGDALNGHENRQEACFNGKHPEWSKCTDVAYMWNEGGMDFYFPEDVGMSLGDEGDPTYIKMAFHYNNPQKEKGRVDSSGLRFVVTSTLRKYDAGILTILAHSSGPYWRIPANVEDFRIFGHCPAECTEEGYKESPDGIHIFANKFHMHYAGTSSTLRHFRDGEELSAVASERNFDYNIQDFLVLADHVQVLPGDDLRVECKFNTMDQNSRVKAGFSARDETCAAVMMFYPRVPFIQSQTYTDIPFTLNHMVNITDQTHQQHVMRRKYTLLVEGQEVKGVSYDEALNHVDWSNPAINRKYQDIQDWGPVRIKCQNKDSSLSRSDKLILPKCIEEYHDEEAIRSCPSLNKPKRRCSGTSPFPDAQTVVDAENKAKSVASSILMTIALCMANYY